jgi:hypothetical protein
MINLRDRLQPENVIFGKNFGWQRNLNVSKKTYDSILVAIAEGKKIRIGNAPAAKYKLLSRCNSTRHGHCIRTIHIM